MIDRHDLDLLSQRVRTAALEELMTRFESTRADTKADGSVVTEADLAMQHRMQRELVAHWPMFELLGEEMDADAQAALLAAPGAGLWCLDPLDGTSNFAAGIPFFAVSLALIVGDAVVAGVVYDPVRDECFSALQGQGAWLNGRRLRCSTGPSTLADAMAMVDLKRLPQALIVTLAKRAPYRSQRSFGSVALDWCWLACGRCQVYLHGGQRLWDYAAGQLILHESGAVGGVGDDFVGDWARHLSLRPRIATAATAQVLLDEWRAWLRGQARESSIS